MPAAEHSRSSADRDVLTRDGSSRKRDHVNPVSNPTMPRSDQPQGGESQTRHRRDGRGRNGASPQGEHRTQQPTASSVAAIVTTPQTEQRTNESSERQPRQGQNERHGRLGGSVRGRSGRDRDRSRGPRRDHEGRGPGVDETYTERKHVERPAGPVPEVDLPRFAELGLNGDLLAGIAAMGYDTPTPSRNRPFRASSQDATWWAVRRPVPARRPLSSCPSCSA